MPAISATTPKANKGSSISDPAPLDSMAPLKLAQDRLARGQNPGPPSGRPGPKSPVKFRVPKGLPPNEATDRRQLELEDELTRGTKENEMWEESQQRHKAGVILGSWEMVTWYGIAGDEVRLSHAPFSLTFNAVGSHGSYPLSVLSRGSDWLYFLYISSQRQGRDLSALRQTKPHHRSRPPTSSTKWANTTSPPNFPPPPTSSPILPRHIHQTLTSAFPSE